MAAGVTDAGGYANVSATSWNDYAGMKFAGPISKIEGVDKILVEASRQIPWYERPTLWFSQNEHWLTPVIITGLSYKMSKNVPVGIRSDMGNASLTTRGSNGATGLGKHAGESIPARSTARDFTAGERAEVNAIGSKTGCQTCGTTNPGTKSGNFVPDHQPPSALNVKGEPQRLYPQCINCSREQGLEIARQLRQGSR